jgi:CheY-like chemotaxis protein
MTISSRSKLALVVDDDDHIREVLQTLLETSGFQVDAVSDGIDVVELKKEYDVILLDMKMPIFDAGSLTAYWRLTDPAILNRVILLSGYTRQASDHDLGTFASLAKPFDLHELLRTVEACATQAQS